MRMGVPKGSKDGVTSCGPVREGRRIKKSIMEKKRLDSISSCMDELLALLSEDRSAKGDDVCKNPKQDESDMLELTMKQWQSAMAVGSTRDLSAKDRVPEADVLVSATGDSSYLKGYKHCIQVVSDLLLTISEPGTECLRQGLLQHLSSRVQELTPAPIVPVSAGHNVTATCKPLVAESKKEAERPSVSSENLANVSAALHPDTTSVLLRQESSTSNYPKRKEAPSATMVTEHKTSPCGASTKTSTELLTSQTPIESCVGSQKVPVRELKAIQELISPQPTPGALSDPTVMRKSKFLSAPSALVRVEPFGQEGKSDILERPAKSRRIQEQEKCVEEEFAIIKEDGMVGEDGEEMKDAQKTSGITR